MKATIKIVILLLFLTPTVAWGSFGITPPYVKNYNLESGDVHEQRIFIVQRDPSRDLGVRISWDVPGADDWFSVDKGSEFILPAGEQKFPIIVSVHVPNNAVTGDYNGHLHIVVTSQGEEEGASGTVGVSMGAKASVELTVDGVAEDPTIAATGLLARFTDNAIPLGASLLILLVAGVSMFFIRKLRIFRLN